MNSEPPNTDPKFTNQADNNFASSNIVDDNIDSITGTSKNKENPVVIAPQKRSFDGERWRESTRSILSLALLGNILLTQVSVVGYIFTPTIVSLLGQNNSNDTKEKGSNSNIVKLNDSTFLYVVNNDKNDKQDSVKDTRELITLIWTSQVSLLGGALGFYFASTQHKK